MNQLQTPVHTTPPHPRTLLNGFRVLAASADLGARVAEADPALLEEVERAFLESDRELFASLAAAGDLP